MLRNAKLVQTIARLFAALFVVTSFASGGSNSVGVALCFDFQELGADGFPVSWQRFNIGSLDVNWASSENHFCEQFPLGTNPNGTGGIGNAVCARSDIVGDGQVDAYFCSPLIDLASAQTETLQFQLRFTGLNPSDTLEVLYGTEAPDTLSIANYVTAYSLSGPQNISLQSETLSTIGWPTSVHVCFRYAADQGGHALIDNVAIGDGACGPDQTDSDSDGVSDSIDNCLEVANVSQQDTDEDGFGNRCDTDFNNDCISNSIDLGIFKSDFFMTGDIQTDINGDFSVSSIDLGIFKLRFFLPPGPSAISSCDVERQKRLPEY